MTPHYWNSTRSPAYALSFALPLLLAYEILAISLSRSEVTGVRNAADVLLKQLFFVLGGRQGLVVFGALLLGAGAVLVGRDLRRVGRIRATYYAGMAAESVLYGLVFGVVAGMLTSLLVPGLGLVADAEWLGSGMQAEFSLPTVLMISLGAGIYEELLFRVLLVGGLAWVFSRGLRWSPAVAGGFAVGLGALVFSWFHYLGPHGDTFAVGSFVFRAVAGVLFSGLYLLRGFGITSWTHALYDVFLALG